MPVWGSASPSTRLELYGDIPFDRNYNNVIRFTNHSDQMEYFKAHLTGYTTGSFEDGAEILGQSGTILFANYLNPDGSITERNPRMTVKVNAVAEQLWKCNYIGWTNNPDTQNLNPQQYDYDTTCPEQWYYAFVTNIYHIANNVSVIEFELDYWQTYHLRITPLQCFVERESPESDVPFSNTLPEEIEPNYYNVREVEVDGLFFPGGKYLVVVFANDEHIQSLYALTQTFLPNATNVDRGRLTSGVYSGLCFFYVPYYNEDDFSGFIQKVIDDGYSDSIVAIFTTAFPPISDTSGGQYVPPIAVDTGVSKQVTQLNGYTFRNNKLMCYPYRKIVFRNAFGKGFELRPEMINSTGGNLHIARFDIHSVTGGCVACPMDYNGHDYALDKILTYQENFQGSFSTNTFAEYVNTQMTADILSAVVGSISGLAPAVVSTGGVGAIGSLATAATAGTNIATNLINAAQKPETSAINSTNLALSLMIGQNTISPFQLFEINVEECNAECAEAIDTYFQMYGYNCSRVKVPNLTHGLWSYVKCSEFEFVPNGISFNGMQAIKNMFEKGIRVWNYTGGGITFDTTDFCNYNTNRSPGTVFE